MKMIFDKLNEIRYDKLHAIKRLNLPEIIQSYGIAIKHTNNSSYKVLCPFHDDKNPSLSVSFKDNKWLWRCFGCHQSGSVIDFVMKKEKIAFKEAYQKLSEMVKAEGQSPNTDIEKPEPKGALEPKESALADFNPQELLSKAVQYYHETFKEHRQGLEYLVQRGIREQSIYLDYQIGFVNGSLRRTLPREGPMVEMLKSIGILNEKGNEVFYNCVIFPILDEDKNIVSLYGRNIDPSDSPSARSGLRRKGHLYLKGSHKSVFNLLALRTSKRIFLTESIIDSLSLIQMGIYETIPLYGTNGLTKDHMELFKKYQTRDIYFCLDNDQPGREAAVRIADELKPLGIHSYHVKLPSDVKDINDYLVLKGGTKESFNELIERAAAVDPKQEELSKDKPKVSTDEAQMIFEFADRSYRVRGLSANRLDQLKVNIKLTYKDGYHLDTFDLYSAKARQTFTLQARKILGIDLGVLNRDLSSMVDLLEIEQAEMLEDKSKKQEAVQMSDVEKEQAIQFLKSANLFEQIILDFKTCGHIGEETNLLLGYLGAVSRKLSTPLAILIISRSASGKTTLQDMILSFTPPEDYQKFTRLTDQALFYQREDALKHKLLAIEEDRGASGCGYSLRVLQSSQRLTNAATIKDPNTGKLRTETYHVSGPTAIMITTTFSEDFDYETYNRFIILTIDESISQTRLILEKQRHNETIEGMLEKEIRDQIQRLHHNAQRVLRSLEVVNPYSRQLTFMDTVLRARREQPKYLSIIKIIALMRQYQKEIKTMTQGEKTIEYIEVDLKDIDMANRIANEVFGRNLDELSPPSRNLLSEIKKMVDELAKRQGESPEEITFSRRDVRQYTKWSDYQIKEHIKELQDLEYLHIIQGKRGKTYEYILAWTGNEDEQIQMGLKDIEKLKEEKDE